MITLGEIEGKITYKIHFKSDITKQCEHDDLIWAYSNVCSVNLRKNLLYNMLRFEPVGIKFIKNWYPRKFWEKVDQEISILITRGIIEFYRREEFHIASEIRDMVYKLV